MIEEFISLMLFFSEEIFAFILFFILYKENENIQYIIISLFVLMIYCIIKLYSYKDIFDYFKIKEKKREMKEENKEMKIFSYNIMTPNDNVIFPFDKRFEKMKDIYFTGEHFVYCLQEVHESFISQLKYHFESIGYICFFEEYHGYKKMSYMTAIRMDKGVKILSSKMIYNKNTRRDFPRKFLDINVLLPDNKELEIINVHFPLDINSEDWEKRKYPERVELTDYLVQYLRSNINVLIVGDYNVLPPDDNNKDRGGLYQLTEFSPFLCKMPNKKTFFGFPYEKENLHGLHGNLDKVCESNNIVTNIKVLNDYFSDIFYTKNRYPNYNYDEMPLSDHFPLEISFNIKNIKKKIIY